MQYSIFIAKEEPRCEIEKLMHSQQLCSHYSPGNWMGPDFDKHGDSLCLNIPITN